MKRPSRQTVTDYLLRGTMVRAEARKDQVSGVHLKLNRAQRRALLVGKPQKPHGSPAERQAKAIIKAEDA